MTLEQLNTLDKIQLAAELIKCCGSLSWVKQMCDRFPVNTKEDLFENAEKIWMNCSKEDQLEAFTHHPKIGDIDSLKKKFASTAKWAAGEQSGASTANEEILLALSKGNKLYEDKFGFIFIVCATGKSAEEMLGMLQSRLANNPEEEIQIAADEQNKITKLRIEKLLN